MIIATLLIGLTGCTSNAEPPAHKPTPAAPSPTASKLVKRSSPNKLLKSTGRTRAPNQPHRGKPGAKPTPSPTANQAAKPIPAIFGSPIPWQDTPPLLLAAPWSPLKPSLTTPTVAIVEIAQNEILIAVNHGDFRNAYTVTDVVSYSIETGVFGQFLVHAVCLNGQDQVVGNFLPRTWTTDIHPRTFIQWPLQSEGEVCAN